MIWFFSIMWRFFVSSFVHSHFRLMPLRRPTRNLSSGETDAIIAWRFQRNFKNASWLKGQQHTVKYNYDDDDQLPDSFHSDYMNLRLRNADHGPWAECSFDWHDTYKKNNEKWLKWHCVLSRSSRFTYRCRSSFLWRFFLASVKWPRRRFIIW